MFPYAHLQSLPLVLLHTTPCYPKITADLLFANIHTFYFLEFSVRGVMQYVLCFVWIFTQHHYRDSSLMISNINSSFFLTA